MSSIDERVVEMKFDNKQFQKGTAESISSLDSLKKALNLDGATKGLHELDAAAGKIDLKHLADGVDGIASRFSGLQAVAFGALAAIGSQVTNLAVNIAQQLGNNVTAALRDGFSDYNTKLTSVQTIMNATGADIATVNGYFKQLDTYADKTVYNLTDMTSSFAKFTNAGVGMDKSVPAIKGIANMVALAGQGANEASIAMYNLSQSIAGGFLTTTDYKSLNLANVATSEWKQNMIDAAVAAGKLEDIGGGAYHIAGTAADKAFTSASLFNEALAEGWASSDVLLKVLGDYGDETTAIGKKALAAAQNVKSLPMMMETLAAAAGTGWTDSFELILGNVTEATELFSMLTNEIGAFTNASNDSRNTQLQIWKDMGGRTALVDAIKNSFQAIKNILGPIGAAWAEVFPPTLGETLFKISVAIRDFTAGLVINQVAQDRLHSVAKALFIGLKFGFDIISGLAQIFGFLFSTVIKMGGALLGLLGPVIDFFTALATGGDKTKETSSDFVKLADVLAWLNTYAIAPLLKGIDWLTQKFDQLLKGDVAGWANKIKGAFAPLAGVAGNVGSNWSKVVEIFNKVVDSLGPFIENVKEAFSGIGKWIGDAFADIDWNAVIAGINTGFLAMIILSIKKYFDQASGFLDSFTGMFDGVSGVLKAFQQDIKAGALIKIAIAIAILAGSLVLLSTVNPNNLGPAVAAMASTVVALVGALKLMEKFISDEETGKLAKLSLILIPLSAALLLMSIAVAKLAALDMAQLAAGTGALVVMLYALVGAAMLLSKIKEDLPVVSLVIISLAGALLTMSTAVLILGSMPLGQMVQGLWALGAILAALTGAIMLLSINNTATFAAAAALVAIAGAIGVLVAAVLVLGVLPIDVLVQGLVTITIMLALLAGAILLLSINNAATIGAAAALLAMAIALNILVGAVVILGSLDMATLAQGLIAIGIMLVALAAAMYLMTGTLVGAAATLVVAAALIVLATAVIMLGSVSIETIVQGIVALVAVILTMAAITLILTPIIPLMFAVGIALAAAGVGVMLMAGAMVVFSIGMALFGPAAVLAAGGLKVLASAMLQIGDAVPAFLLVGAGLLVFGVGAAVAGAGILVLAGGLLLLGVALALLGAVGIIGATATIAVVNALMTLIGQALGMAGLGAAFLALGAGLLAMGAGAVLAGAGLLLVGAGLLLIATAATLGSLGLTILAAAIERMAPHVEEMETIAGAIKKLAASAGKAGESSRTAATGLNSLASAASKGANGVERMGNQMLSSFLAIVLGTKLVATAYAAMSTASLNSVNTFKMGVQSAVAPVVKSSSDMVTGMVNTIVSGLNSQQGSMSSAGNGIGQAIIQGMANGLSGGSWKVTDAAREVAQDALAASKAALGVHSPSREYYAIGDFSDQGLADGMTDNKHKVVRASTDVADSALQAMKDSMSKASKEKPIDMDFNPVIRPVMDLSEVQKGANTINGLMASRPVLDVSTSYSAASALVAEDREIIEQRPEDRFDMEPRIQFVQYNSSPKALSQAEIYRQTKNQISQVKGGLPTANAK